MLDTSRDKICQLLRLRDHLVLIHCDSIHGPRAKDYRAVYMEYIHLHDQFRGIAADHILVKFRLQKLIIDTVQARENVRLRKVRRLFHFIAHPLIQFPQISSSVNHTSLVCYSYPPLAIVLTLYYRRVSVFQGRPIPFLSMLYAFFFSALFATP